MVNEGYDSYIGKQIKSYTILQKLGSGGFACVYLARNYFNEPVAIKLLNPEYNRPENKQYFLKEARFLQELKHQRYILPILECGESGDTPYIIVEYTPGGTLRERINTCHLMAIDDALTILMQIGKALHVAHEHGIVHCDLKPENILFNDKGDAVLGACKGIVGNALRSRD
jgi:serine/threonine protein kinase